MDYKLGEKPAYAGGDVNASSNSGGDRQPKVEARNRQFDNRHSKSPLRAHAFCPRAELLSNSPVIFISPEAYRKQCVYIDLAPKEVGWMGSVAVLESGQFLIEDTYLLEQKVTDVETELSKDGMEKLSVELIESRADGVSLVNKMRFWGHSHVFMGTTASSTDESTMTRLGTEGPGISWYIRGIFNKHGRAEFTIYLYDLGYRILDAPWAVYDPATGRTVDVPKKKFFPSMGELFATKTNFVIEPVASASENAPGKETALPDASKGALGQQSVDATKEQTAEPEPNLFDGFPEILTPSAVLRATIKAEYKKKVTERKYFFASWGNQDKQTAAEQTTTNVPLSAGEDSSTVVSRGSDEITDAFPLSGYGAGSARDDDERSEPLAEKVARFFRGFFRGPDSE